jgi:ankyrin repeat protein
MGCRKQPVGPPPPPKDLAAAAAAGDVTAVARFLALGSDPNRLDTSGVPPLYEAVVRPKNGEVIRMLASHGAKFELPGKLPILAEADITNMQSLVDSGADVNAPAGGKWTALRARVDRIRDLDSIGFLIANGANPNPPGDPLVLLAAKQNNAEVAKMLLDAGATLGPDKGGEVLGLSIRFRNSGLFDALLGHGADATWCDKYGDSLVIYAIQSKCTDWIDDLVRAGADPNRANNAGVTPFWLVRDDKIEARLALIRNGAYNKFSPEEVLAERKRNADGGK